MIKVEVIEDFTLQRYDELKNIERAMQDVKGKLFAKDRFECSKELADYLLGNNPLKKAVVKVIEIEPVEDDIKKLEKDLSGFDCINELYTPKKTTKKNKKK